MSTASSTSPHATDSTLVARARQGETRAFAALVDRHQKLACAVAYSCTGDLSACEDIAQEAFVIAWNRLHTISAPEKFASWLAGITRNAARAYRRHQKRHAPVADYSVDALHSLAAPGPSPLQTTAAREDLGKTCTALRRLPRRYREPLVLYFALDESYKCVADALSLPEATVRQRLCRARKKLAEQTGPVAQRAATCGTGVALSTAVLASIVSKGAWAAPSLGKATLSSKLVTATASVAGATALICAAALIAVISRAPKHAQAAPIIAGSPELSEPAPHSSKPLPTVPLESVSASYAAYDSPRAVPPEGQVLIGTGKKVRKRNALQRREWLPLTAHDDSNARRRSKRSREAEVRHGPAKILRKRPLMRPSIDLRDIDIQY